MEKEMILKLMEMLISNDGCNSQSSLASKYVGKYCIIRTYSAGVHFGKVVQAEGKEVVLNESRRIWSWSDRFTLSKIAIDGLEDAKMSCVVDDLYLSEAIEIIPVTDKSREVLYELEEHKA